MTQPPIDPANPEPPQDPFAKQPDPAPGAQPSWPEPSGPQVPGTQPGQPQHGQPPYGQPQQGQPQYGPPPTQDPASYAAAPPPSPGYGYGSATQSVPPGMHYDAQSGLVLPAGVELASVGRRIGSYFLGILLFIVTLGLGFIIWGLIVGARGQTPAQQVLKMRCWRDETKTNASWGWMFLREVIGALVEGILSVITQLISLIMMVTGRQRKCLKDHIASTVVLYDPNGVLAPRS
jgi:RDD family